VLLVLAKGTGEVTEGMDRARGQEKDQAMGQLHILRYL
jgi:hypothetical protein